MTPLEVLPTDRTEMRQLGLRLLPSYLSQCRSALKCTVETADDGFDFPLVLISVLADHLSDDFLSDLHRLIFQRFPCEIVLALPVPSQPKLNQIFVGLGIVRPLPLLRRLRFRATDLLLCRPCLFTKKFRCLSGTEDCAALSKKERETLSEVFTRLFGEAEIKRCRALGSLHCTIASRCASHFRSASAISGP